MSNYTRESGMATVEEYRRHAAECLRLAQEAKTADDRLRLMQMAQAWHELADKLDDQQEK
jgi:hypothetical protein